MMVAPSPHREIITREQYKILNKSIAAYESMQKELNEYLAQGYKIDRIDTVSVDNSSKGQGYIIWLVKSCTLEEIEENKEEK